MKSSLRESSPKQRALTLDFDGGVKLYRNAELGMDIPVGITPSGIDDARRTRLAAALRREGFDVAETGGRTIHVGRTDAFDAFGRFAGLAEGIGEGDAFVFLDDSASDAELLAVIRHEAGHILGTFDHGGAGLARYAYTMTTHQYRYSYSSSSVYTYSIHNITAEFVALTPPNGAENLLLAYNESYKEKLISYKAYDPENGHDSTIYYTTNLHHEGYIEASNITAGTVTIEGGKATRVTADKMSVTGNETHDSIGYYYEYRYLPGFDLTIQPNDYFNYHFHQGGAYECVVGNMDVIGNAVAKSCTVNYLTVSGADTGENASGNHATAENCTVIGDLYVRYGGEAKNTIVKYDADTYIFRAVATNLINERGGVGLADGATLNNAKVNNITVHGENVKVSGSVTCDNIFITSNFDGTITVKLDLRDYAVPGYTKRIEDSDGRIIREIKYFPNYTTRIVEYNYTYDPFGNEQYSTTVSYGTFDDKDKEANGNLRLMSTWGDYRFSVDIGCIYNKAAMSNITLDFGGTEKLFDSGELYVQLPECYEINDGDGVNVGYQPAVNYYTTIPFNTTSDENKWSVDEFFTDYRTDSIDTSKQSTTTRFLYNPTLHGEVADVLWLENGWTDETEYIISLPPEVMGGNLSDLTIHSEDGGGLGQPVLQNSTLVVSGANEGNITITATDSEKRDHECELDLWVVPEEIPILGKLGAQSYSEALKKAQKERLTQVNCNLPNNVHTKLMGMSFDLTNMNMSFTVNWTKREMELKAQGKMEWEIGKGDNKKLTLDLSGDNFISVFYKGGSFGWDIAVELKVPDFKIGKFEFSNVFLKMNKGENSVSVGCYLKLPGISYAFGGSIGIVDGYLDSMSIGVSGLNAMLGTTGLMLQDISGKVEGIATKVDMIFGGNMKLTYGPEISIDWDCDWLGIDNGKYSLLEINLGATISTGGEITGNASFSSLGGFITGSGEVKASIGNFSVKGNFSMLNGCISIEGELNSGPGGVVITGKGSMTLPREKFFGPLAGVGVTVDAKADFDQRYIVAWETIEIFGNKFAIGVKTTFYDRSFDVELLGSSDIWKEVEKKRGNLRMLTGAKGGDEGGLRGATPPSASEKYTVSELGTAFFQISFTVAASTASASLVYDGVEYTQAAIQAGLYDNMQIVNELTGLDCITIAVNNASLGEWTLNAYGDENATFGAYTFEQAVEKPVITSVTPGAGGRCATIHYALGDLSALENATVSIFRAAGDATENNGALIGEFAAADATGTFEYVMADDDMPGGNYAFYLMVSSDNRAPVYGDLSAACDFLTIDTEAPDQIQSISAEWRSSGSTLTWEEPHDNIGVAGYKISYRASEEDEWSEADVTTTSFTFNGVPNGMYTFRVAAYDAAGNIAAWSVEDSVLVNLAANARLHHETLEVNADLAEFESAYQINAAEVKVTAAQNTLISDSTLGDAETRGIVENTVINGAADFLPGAQGYNLTVNGELLVGVNSGIPEPDDPFAEVVDVLDGGAVAMVDGVTVAENGVLTVGSYGKVGNVTVASGGVITLTGNAEFTDLTIEYGGEIHFSGTERYDLTDDITTAVKINNSNAIFGNGHHIRAEQYKQTAEYDYEYWSDGSITDRIALVHDLDKIVGKTLQVEIDTNAYGYFKIADKAQSVKTITVIDHTDGASGSVGMIDFGRDDRNYTQVGNALCALIDLTDGLYLKTVASSIEAPVVSVAQSADNAYGEVLFSVNDEEPRGSYSYRYSLNPDMTEAVLLGSNFSTSAQFTKELFGENATYYVQAKVKNSNNVESSWSDAVAFTVVQKLLPDAPTVLTVTGATNVNSNVVTFTAGGVDQSETIALDWRFRYADNPEMKNAIVITTGQRYGYSTTINKSSIVDGKDYYVQAGVRQGNDWSYWSDTVVFNTQGWDYDGITVGTGGALEEIWLDGGKKARNITVTEGGRIYGDRGGVVDNVTIDGGFFRVGSSTTNLTVNSGEVMLYENSNLTDVVVNGGSIRLMYGTLNGATVGVNGLMALNSSYTPTITGTITIQGRMTVYNYHPGVSTDAKFVFDLGAHEAETMRDTMFIDFTSPLLGSCTFTVKLDNTPEVGDYTLTYVPKSGEFYAGLAAADGSSLGVMALGGDAIKYNEFYYSLVAMSSRVYLHVSADDGPALLGKVKLSKNGTAYDSNDYYDYLTVSAASECDHALVEAGGQLKMVTVGNGGMAEAYGEVRGATVEAGGKLTMNEGGLFTGNPVTIMKGGEVIVNGGSIQQSAKFEIAGTLTVNGALQSYEDDGDSYYATYHDFRFVLDDFDAPNTDVLISDYELVKTCNASFSVSVSANQAEGEYQLMGNAASYAYGVTLYVEGGASYGEYIWFGGNGTEINGRNYALAVKDNVLTLTVENCLGSDVPALTQTWDLPSDTYSYVVEYSTDNFEHVMQVTVYGNALDAFSAPAGCQWRVRPEDSDEWSEPDTIYAAADDDEPKLVRSNADGVDDVFFARAGKVWEGGYQAKHVGSLDSDWQGTGERVDLAGKNRLGDLFEGSDDANVLLLTDDANGDALFVDDIYTALPGSLKDQQARIAQIDEIRAGAGDDVVDMTSQLFEYVGDGVTVRGGDGDDTIWAVGSGNYLFGDAGDDRIVGGAGMDFIAGGAGNDSMHGGGGMDVFTFGGNWGVDTVEQLDDEYSQVMLWFAEGDHANWNASTLTYTDGSNSVTVKGVSADQVEIYIGDEFPWDFEMMSELGIFAESTSRNVFEEKGKGILASL